MTSQRFHGRRSGRPAVLFALWIAMSAAGAQSGPEACAELATWAGNAELRIDTAQFHDGRAVDGQGGARITLPSHCHVAGSFEHRTGVGGRDYAIGFAINLPAEWNGRLLFQGGGGLNGTVREPVGAVAAGDTPALSRGFAVVSTDSGHEGAVFDGSFMADQQALLNFQFLANAKTLGVVRPIVERYYASAPHHSYFVGCSTGGREGMIMAQRYPNLFDGIVSGAPAMRTTVSNLALRWISHQYADVEEANPRDPFSEQEERLIMGALMNACDALDGNADGLIFNRQACTFDPRDLSCSAAPGSACLADDKAEALARAMAGPVSAAGKHVYASYPYDSGIDDEVGLPGLLIAGGTPPIGPNGGDLDVLDVDAEYIDALSATEALGSTATNYNVSTFIGNGGKHIFYHGEADPWFSANDTLRYFERLGEANADLLPIEDFGRMYLVPGMGHCSGGEQTVDRFDLLTPLVEWVEEGVAPAAVPATGASMPGQGRPLCAWPAYAHFDGGDAASADSYRCAMP